VGPARLAVHEDVHEPALGQRLVGLLPEQPDLVGDAAAAEAADPQAMVAFTGEPRFKPIADEAADRLAAALASLASDSEGAA
jgi:hypothetical protein